MAKSNRVPIQRDCIAELRTLYRDPYGDASAIFTLGVQQRFSLQGSVLDLLPSERKLRRVDSCSVNLFITVDAVRPLDESESLEADRYARWVRYLCAAHVSIPKEFLKAFTELVESGLIPVPSVTITSQREVVCLWLLRDINDASRPPMMHKGRSGTGQLYRDIQARLADLLSADLHTAIARRHITDVIPLPGPRARWERAASESGVPTYTLSDLYQALYGKAEAKKRGRRVSTSTKQSDKPKDPNRQRRMRDLQHRHIRLVELLGKWRHHLDANESEFAVQLVAISMKTLFRLKGDSHDRPVQRREIRRKIDRLNGSFFQPPLADEQVEQLLNDALVPRPPTTEWIKDSEIARRMNVTPDESKRLRNFGYKIPPAPQFRDRSEFFEQPVSRRDKRIAGRHEALLRIRSEQGDWPSVRQAVELLKAVGITASVGTVQADLRSLRQA